MPLLELRNVTRRYGRLSAVDNVSLSIEAGEFFTLLGPSGCGKTTILRMIAGFDLPDAGQILLDGKDLADTPPEKRPLHTVFQSYALFPHLSVADNIAFPLKMSCVAPAERARRVRDILEAVSLPDKADAMPHELSGGQQQRVALARALVTKPRLLLLDEPLAALDHKLREQMQVELIGLQREVGITFVFVTHHQPEALALSHRIAVMNQGHVEQLDEPDVIYAAPRNRFVAHFIGDINLLDCTLQAREGDHLCLAISGLGEVFAPARTGGSAGQAGAFAIRPEQVLIGDPDQHTTLPNRFTGVVRELLYSGDVTTYKVALAGGLHLQALLPNVSPGSVKFFEVGDAVSVAWPADAGLFLDA
jgi:spermidine/putrescine transport system ATP-binding protein